MSDRPIRVLAVSRSAQGASFQQRVLNYVPHLARRGIEVDARPMPKGLLDQRRLARQARDYDVVWWHKYLPVPWLPTGWAAHQDKIVYDFDDPVIYNSHATDDKPAFTRRWKFSRHVRRCRAILAASQTLVDQALAYNPTVHLVPMAVDLPPEVPARPDQPAQLLWLGGRATFRYLAQIKDVLETLGRLRPDVTLRIVGHQPFACEHLRVEYRPWSLQQEQAALGDCGIGLCPMPDTPWTRGKCPYKVLQYMAYGMAWVGSAVGENFRQAGPDDDQKFRGLCASNPQQWLDSLVRLIDRPAIRRAAGQRGRAHIQRNHSREVLASRIADVFTGVLAP